MILIQPGSQAGFTSGPEGETRPISEAHVLFGDLIFTEAVWDMTACAPAGLWFLLLNRIRILL